MAHGSAAQSSSFVARTKGVITLNSDTFRAIASDRSATAQAALVVILASVSSGISSVADDGRTGLVVGAMAALLAWFAGSCFAWIAGDKLIPAKSTDASLGSVLRVLGWADAPMIFAAATLLTGVGGLISFVIGLLSVLTTLLALKAAFDTSTIRALFIALISKIVSYAMLFLVAAIAGITIIAVHQLF